MKKLIILLVCVALLIAAGAMMIIVPLTLKYAVTQYTRELREHVAAYSEGGTVTAEYGGTVTSLTGGNVSYLSEALSRSTMKRVFNVPDYDESEAARIELSDGAVYIVFDATPEGADDDTAYIIYTYDGKTQSFRVEEMKTMERVALCVSAEGFSGENETISSKKG
jgi:hypothetical protein